MNKIHQFTDQLACEVIQKDELQKNLIHQILVSRRLLSEHLENLEQVTPFENQHESKPSNYLTLFSTSSTVASSYLMYNYFNSNLRYLIPCIAGIVPVMYLNKKIKMQQRETCETYLKEFIKALDDFEFFVKKATNFLNDAHYIKSQGDILSRCNLGKNLSVDLAYLIKRVIRALYCFVKYLEYCFKIDAKYLYYYQDIDDVDNCSLMIEEDDETVSPSKFKDLFALFAYVQSYVLYRLALIYASNVEVGKYITMKKICDMTSKIKHQTSLLPNFMLIQKEETAIQKNVQKLIDIESNKTASKELVQIRSSTVDFTLKALSLINKLKDYQNVIMQLPNNHQNADKKNLDGILNDLEDIGSQLASCSDEQTRLLILVKKYFNKDIEELQLPEKTINSEDECELKIVGGDDITSQSDDFFYVDPQQENIGVDKDCNEKEQDKFDDLDEEDSHIKLTKKCFKPVLAQLKERIVPIEVDMKEREKKVLKEKGIEINEECNNNKIDLSDPYSDSDEEDMDGFKLQRKNNFSQKKFDENRDFLQSKNQVNLFSKVLTFPTQNKFHALEEDVLE